MLAFYNGGDINRSHLNILGGGIGGRNDSAAAVAGHVSVSELRGALCVRGEGGQVEAKLVPISPLSFPVMQLN